MKQLAARELIPFIKARVAKAYYDKAIQDIQKNRLDVLMFVVNVWDHLTNEKDKKEYIKIVANDVCFGPILFDKKIKGGAYEGLYLATLLGENK
jgi:hypothetical protein